MNNPIPEASRDVIRRVIGQLERRYKAFAHPVVEQWPSLKEDYLSVIEKPVALVDVERRIEPTAPDKFTTWKDLLEAMNMIVKNCVKYNGVDNPLTVEAFKMNAEWLQRCGKIAKNDQLPRTNEELNDVLEGRIPASLAIRTPKQDADLSRSMRVNPRRQAVTPGPKSEPLQKREPKYEYETPVESNAGNGYSEMPRPASQQIPQTQHNPSRVPTLQESKRLSTKIFDLECSTLRRIILNIVKESGVYVDPHEEYVTLDFTGELRPYFWVLYEKVMKARTARAE